MDIGRHKVSVLTFSCLETAALWSVIESRTCFYLPRIVMSKWLSATSEGRATKTGSYEYLGLKPLSNLLQKYPIDIYSHAPYNDVSVKDGPHIRQWSHKIITM